MAKLSKKEQEKIEKEQMNNIASEIRKTEVGDFLNNYYLPFTYYTIKNRALISDDGLKPVQRRSIYEMWRMGLRPSSSFVKAGRISGNVMGNFHPHGNISIEDSIARLAQWHSMRVPPIDYYGSVGPLPGDEPAAARYWEAKLSKAGVELVKEINENAAKMTKNYDGTLDEPLQLPIKWPLGIINGTQGIATGYASTIPPHNPTEVMNACIELFKNPEMTMDELIKIMPGPDFPTGGELIGIDVIREYYSGEKSSFTVRGKFTIEKLTRGRTQINFYELPYQVSAESVKIAIQKAKTKNKLKDISECVDLSSKHLNLEIIVKAGANINKVLQNLFKLTPIESKFSVNPVVLLNGTPHQVSMFELLNQFLTFRVECVKNKLNYKLSDLKKQLNRSEGLLKVLLDVDKAIEIIRKSSDSETAKERLKKHFKLDDEQAEYILSLQLRKLTKADSLELKNKNKELKDEIKSLDETINNQKKFMDFVINELEETREIIKDKRRTSLNKKSLDDINKENKMAQKEVTANNKNRKCFITYLSDGRLYKTQDKITEVLVKNKPFPIAYQIETKTQEDVIFIMKNGDAERMSTTFIPFDIITSTEDLGLKNECGVVGLAPAESKESDKGLLVVTKDGEVTIVDKQFPKAQEFNAVNTEEIAFVQWVTNNNHENDTLILASDAGFIHAFPINQIRVAKSGAKTTKSMSLGSAKIANAILLRALRSTVIVSTTGDTIKVTEMKSFPNPKNRVGKGVINHKLKSSQKVQNVFVAHRDTILVLDKSHNVVNLPEPNGRGLAAVKYASNDLIMGVKSL